MATPERSGKVAGGFGRALMRLQEVREVSWEGVSPFRGADFRSLNEYEVREVGEVGV